MSSFISLLVALRRSDVMRSTRKRPDLFWLTHPPNEFLAGASWPRQKWAARMESLPHHGAAVLRVDGSVVERTSDGCGDPA